MGNSEIWYERVATGGAGSFDITTTTTIPANTSITVTIFEDKNNNGSGGNSVDDPDGTTHNYDASDSVTLSGGSGETNTLTGFDSTASENAYIIRIELDDDGSDPTLDSPEFDSLSFDPEAGGTATPVDDDPDQGSSSGGNALWDAFVKPDNLYLNLVTPSTMTDAVSVMFLGIMTGFGYFSVKLRSLLVGLGWMLLIVSFALAVLVDTSLIYFWLAVVFTAVMVVVALADGVVSG